MPTPRSFSQRPYAAPPGATELLLIRHGASADSLEGETFELVEGQGDPPLSEVGRHQAERLALRLAPEPFDGLYVSTLRRTPQTAAPLVERTGLAPVVDADLREVFLGEWEGGLLRQKAVDGDPLFQRVMKEQRLPQSARCAVSLNPRTIHRSGATISFEIDALSTLRKAKGCAPLACASSSAMAAPWLKTSTRPPG